MYLQIATGDYLAVLQGHANDISCIKFSYNDLCFVSGGMDGMVLVWMFAE